MAGLIVSTPSWVLQTFIFAYKTSSCSYFISRRHHCEINCVSFVNIWFSDNKTYSSTPVRGEFRLLLFRRCFTRSFAHWFTDPKLATHQLGQLSYLCVAVLNLVYNLAQITPPASPSIWFGWEDFVGKSRHVLFPFHALHPLVLFVLNCSSSSPLLLARAAFFLLFDLTHLFAHFRLPRFVVSSMTRFLGNFLSKIFLEKLLFECRNGAIFYF